MKYPKLKITLEFPDEIFPIRKLINFLVKVIITRRKRVYEIREYPEVRERDFFYPSKLELAKLALPVEVSDIIKARKNYAVHTSLFDFQRPRIYLYKRKQVFILAQKKCV